ncbi:MAG: porin family protein [Rickettsiales bacterium]|jgi:opacity protein-like surface antigen|nr:porin family protein [Rickettsiales bacterium]
MNKKILALASAAAIVASPAGAFVYAGAGVGTAKMKIDGDKYGSAASYLVSTGFELPIPLVPVRAEIEYSKLGSSEDGLDTAVSGVGVNAYVGLPILPLVKPYLGFGLANLKLEADGTGVDLETGSKVVPQYMVGLDLSIPLIPVAGGIEYRYIDGRFDKDGVDYKTKVSAILAKIRVDF